MGFLDDWLNEEGVDYILVEMPEDIFKSLKITTESCWQDSSYKNYMYRVDNATDHTQQRHVHIAKSKHINTKTQQVAWNQDGTRHDKKSFNASLGSSKNVQDIARAVLNLDATIALEAYKENELSLEYLTESIDCKPIMIKVVI